MPDPRTVDLGYALTLPPAEAVRYFEAKGYAITWNWQDLAEQAHTRAFTVSKMARFDLLTSTRRIVKRVLAEGRTLREGAAELEARLRKAGWWGRQTLVGPDGGAERVQLGSPHRIRTILRTNIAVAYAAGRHQRQAELRDARPYWQYVATLDPSTRDRHRELHGLTLRADDPAWETIYPPNGFNCRCRVRALTERQVRERRIRVVEQTTTTPTTREIVNKRTGEIQTRRGARVSWGQGRARRTFEPDPGWAHRPGALPTRPVPRGTKPVAGQPTWKSYGRPAAQDLPRAAALPRLPDEVDGAKVATRAQAEEVIRRELWLTSDFPWIETPVGRVFLGSERTIAHLTEKLESGDARYRLSNRILPTLAAPDEIWMTEYPGQTYRLRYLKAFAADRSTGAGSLVVVEEAADGQLFYNFFPASARYLDANRAGALLYPRDGN